MSGRITFLVGICRSGKSTIAKKWANYEVDIHNGEVVNREHQKTKNENPRVIVCADTIRLTFGHRFHAPFEGFIAAIKDTMTRSLLLSGHDVLIDGTHTTKSSIIKLFEIDPDADYAVITTSPEVCRERAVATDQLDLLPVIDRMSEQLSKLPPIEEIRKELKGKG